MEDAYYIYGYQGEQVLGLTAAVVMVSACCVGRFSWSKQGYLTANTNLQSGCNTGTHSHWLNVRWSVWSANWTEDGTWFHPSGLDWCRSDKTMHVSPLKAFISLHNMTLLLLYITLYSSNKRACVNKFHQIWQCLNKQTSGESSSAFHWDFEFFSSVCIIMLCLDKTSESFFRFT